MSGRLKDLLSVGKSNRDWSCQTSFNSTKGESKKHAKVKWSNVKTQHYSWKTELLLKTNCQLGLECIESAIVMYRV